MAELRATRDCHYCGLPTGGRAAADEPLYCCSGCRFAAAITGAGGEDGQARWMMARLGLALFFTMNVMVFTMLLWSQPEGPAAAAGEPGLQADVFYSLARHACLLFTAPVLLLLGGPLLTATRTELRAGQAALNLLLVAGVAAAFGISAWATWRGSGHVYFEVTCMVLVAVTLGRWLEATGKARTTAALRDLRTLLPDRVRRRTAAGEEEVPLAGVGRGDVLRILPGEHVPTDGRIVAGTAALDERAVTGESEPVVKYSGDLVHSGTCDLDGELFVEVTAAPGAGTLERLIDSVAAAAGHTRPQRLAERLSAWFLPLVLAVAAATAAAHWRAAGPAAGVLAGLAVVVVSCPCALGLATPLAVWAAIGSATRRHVLVRDGDAFLRLAAPDVVCFDKTGTLTTGCRVTAIELPAHDGAAAATPGTALADLAADVLALAAGLAHGSTHVHAAAIAAAAVERGIAATPVRNVRSIAGCGLEAELPDGRAVRLGSGRWIAAGAPALAAPRWSAHETATDPPSLLAVDGIVRGGFRFAEELRPEAAATVAALRDRGAETLLLSGDRADRAAAVAEPLGLAWRAPLLPAEKLAAIEAFRAAGRRVAMVGDGINDAPALARADVGVALGCGADVSRWSADICLLRDDLAALPPLVDLAARTRRTIRWNLLWAFGYNTACIPLAAAGVVHPAVAAAAMVASSLLVVTNSLRLADGPAAEAVP